MAKESVARGVMRLPVNLYDDFGVTFDPPVDLCRIITVGHKECYRHFFAHVRGLRRDRLDDDVLRDGTIQTGISVIFAPFVVFWVHRVVRVYVRGLFDRHREAFRNYAGVLRLPFVKDVRTLRRVRVVCRGGFNFVYSSVCCGRWCREGIWRVRVFVPAQGRGYCLYKGFYRGLWM